MSAKFGRTPFTWSVSSGSLPLGLSLDPVGVGNNRDTIISGTTSAPVATYTFEITITDDDGFSDSKMFDLEIVAAGGVGSPRISQNYNI
ncbi:MAG: putative Ig domain-containing protein, partial [Candidatus Mariimomonas ferrooxydans]